MCGNKESKYSHIITVFTVTPPGLGPFFSPECRCWSVKASGRYSAWSDYCDGDCNHMTAQWRRDGLSSARSAVVRGWSLWRAAPHAERSFKRFIPEPSIWSGGDGTFKHATGRKINKFYIIHSCIMASLSTIPSVCPTNSSLAPSWLEITQNNDHQRSLFWSSHTTP